ncbi:2306_t:CDS:2 [Cetraspora pellucida]|uniref:2306_t:CDS:1 n=1 Tax=Cetraspora pellucida TaxID=1433469 RepID=A0A9N8ZUZ1_9GLOM|nr:2306_t:CDS:2 [Cetraspora pellucida]
MKKVHNTCHKGKGMPIVFQAIMPEGLVRDYRRRSSAENQQVLPEDNNFCKENSTATDIEGSSNLCDDRAGNKIVVSLFTKLTRGRATYSTFSLRANISTKNRNALLFDMQRLNQISTNDIVVTFYSKIEGDFIGVKPHFVIETYLLSIRLRRVPIIDKDTISEEIKWAFDRVGTIIIIKLLLYKGTPIHSDQWVIIFNITEDVKLAEQMPRYVNIMDQKFKKHKNKQSGRYVKPKPVREMVEEKTGNPYINRSQNGELREATEIE